VSDAKTENSFTIKFKTCLQGNSVLPEETRLVNAHLGDLLKILMQSEED